MKAVVLLGDRADRPGIENRAFQRFPIDEADAHAGAIEAACGKVFA